MAEQGPHGETVLQRSALLQVTGAQPVSHKHPLNLSQEHLKLSGCASGGAEQQRLRLGSARHRVRSSSSQLPSVDLA